LETLQASKYTNKLIGNTAFMLLNKPIGVSSAKEPAISGEAFASEMYGWKSEGKDVTVKINCIGGSVLQGWDMVDSIIETKAKTENIGFAYSMGGICLIVGSDRTAYPHSRAMIHAPRREDGKKDYHTELLKDQFRTILKNHTKFTEAEINEMVDSGKDYFFDAKQQLEKGMVDRIANTGGYNNEVMKLSEMEAYAYINKQFETENNEDMNVQEFIAKLFPGKNDAESMINMAQMKSENEALVKAKAEYEAKITALETENTTLKTEKGQVDAKVKAATLIDGAVKAGKFKDMDAATKAKWVENATANYDVVKSMIDSLPSGKIVAAATIPNAENKGGGDMTYEWLMKNNPTELARIAEEDVQLFNRLSEEWVAKQKEAVK
jgi:ATP-dependent protease ClpP protease subunit